MRNTVNRSVSPLGHVTVILHHPVHQHRADTWCMMVLSHRCCSDLQYWTPAEPRTVSNVSVPIVFMQIALVSHRSAAGTQRANNR